MTLLFMFLAAAAALMVTLVTCLQVLYLESLRIRARELPALQFFRETLEAKIGLTTEQGALRFSVVKHVGMLVTGCLLLAITVQSASFAEAIVAACLVAAGFVVIGVHIVPQIVYRKSSGRGLLPLAPLFRVVAWLARPLTFGIEFVDSLFELGHGEQNAEQTRPEEHIEALISAGEEEGIIEEGDRELIQSVVAFGDKTVREVMTPRPRIVGISQEATLEELRQLVISEQYSRIPAYEHDIDSVVGFVHVRDMFEVDEEQRSQRKVRDIMRPIRAVPESKAVNDLLKEMQEEGAHMAVVVDEYGSTAGIVTLEDMVEEIVGEIHDEHEPSRDFRQEPDGSYVISGSFDVSRLENLLDFHPQNEPESTTAGGLVTEWLGHVPVVGEETERDGILVTVLAANGRRVDQLRVAKAAPK